MLRRIIALAGAGVLAASALAGPQAVASRAHVVNAGVVILDSSKQSGGQPVSAAPFAFYNLDQARAIKPAGWQFSNPHAPSMVTAAIAARWGATEGTRITKAQAPYWEVSLTNASDASLSDYDVLLVAPAFYVSLNPSEREKLRKFVDKGGLLWIDPAAMASATTANYGFDETNNFPLPFAVTPLSSGSVYDQSDYSHPLLTTPNGLTQTDMRLINGNGSFGLRAVSLSDEGADSILPFEYPIIEDFYKLRAVSLDTQGGTTLPTISVGRIGDGYIVVTARGAALNLNGGLSNSGFTASSSDLGPSGIASARLAINMVSLTSDFRQSGGGTRKTNSSIADVSAPLLRRWQDTSVTTTSDAHLSQPTIYKGFVYVSTGSTVRCYEANPSGGLTSPGQTFLWESASIPGPISAPVVAEVPDADTSSSVPQDQVLVTTGSGDLYVIDGRPFQPGDNPSTTRTVTKIDRGTIPTSNSTTSPNPPAVDEGIAYVVDTANGSSSSSTGRVWIADLRTLKVVAPGTQPWSIGGSNADFPAFASSATVAWIPTADGSDAVDKVLYIPFNPSAVTLGPTVAGFSSIWVGTKGEKPVSYQVDTTASPAVLQVDTRALQAGNLPIFTPTSGDLGGLGPRITLMKKVGGVATGDVYSASDLKDIFTGQVDGPDGQLRFTLKSGYDDTWFQNNVAGIRVDYTIDWGRAAQNSVSQSVERGRITFSSSDPGRRILGNLAVTSQGTVFAVYADPDMNNSDTSHIGNGGTVFAFKEDAGRGSFRCVMRYDLFPSHSITPNQGAPIAYETNFQDVDAVQNLVPSLLSGDVQNMVFMGGPCVRGDQVYVVADGQKTSGGFPIEVTVLLAFKSEPDTATIKVGDLGDNVNLVQPDFLRTPDSNRKLPQTNSLLTPASFKYERDTGTIRIENLMGINRGQIQACLSLSQPVLIRRAGQGDTLVEPDATGGRWSPLQWYAVLHGLQLRAYNSSNSIVMTPVVAGDTLYLAGTSLLPQILSSGFSGILNNQSYSGMCYGFNVNLGATDQFLVPTPGRTWNKQFVQLLATSTSFKANTNVLWPQLEGSTDMATFAQRVNQTVLGSGLSKSRMAYGIVAGDNAAVAWGDKGVYGFTRADVLICDQKKVARYDAAGNLLWSSDASLTAGEAGEEGVGKVKPLLRPTRAYPLGANDLLIVDSGGNRIVRMNQAGIETRSIEAIRVNPELTIDGWTAAESTKLNNPHDVTVFSEYVDTANNPFTTKQSSEYWRHYVIADTGNRRIIELIDRYAVDSQGHILNPIVVNNVPQLGVLLWHSPAAVSGKGFAYSSLARVYVPGTGSGSGHYAYLAGIGSSTPTRAAVGLDTPVGASRVADNGGNGGVVLFDPTLTSGSQVLNMLALPSLASTKLWDEATNAWDSGTNLNQPSRTRPIGAVNSVTAVANGNTISVMIADNTGIYEGTITTGGTSTSETLSVDWMLPNAVYRAMRRVDTTGGTTPGTPTADNPANLNATYARRLDSGEVLIVNGYAGSTRGTKLTNGTFTGQSSFLGEVIQIDGTVYDPTFTNLGFYGPTAIKYELRGVTNGRNIIMPVFADRR